MIMINKNLLHIRNLKLKERFRRINALIKHKIAFAKIEKTLYGSWSIRSITHDLDKLLFYFTPMPIRWNRDMHKIRVKHHNPKTFLDYREQFVDWECARFTKRKSTLTGIQWCEQKYELGKTSEIDYSIQRGLIFELKTRLGNPIDWYK